MSNERPLRVLYVAARADDAADILQLLAKATPPITCVYVPTIEQAHAVSIHDNFDAMLFEYDFGIFPDDLTELCEYIRPRVSVALLQASREAQAIGALRAGADTYVLRHPEALAELPALLRRLCHPDHSSVVRRALYVGPSDDCVRLLEGVLLRDAPYVQVDVCPDYTEVLQRLEAARCDVVLVEHQPPVFDGVELLHALSERAASPPFIVLVANNDEAFAVAALRGGAADCITKHVGYVHRLVWRIEQHCSPTQTAHAAPQSSASEERFRALFAATPVAMIVCDDHGRCLDANAAAANVTGLPQEVLLQRTLADLVHPFDRTSVYEMQAALPVQRMWKGKVHIMQEDGDTRLLDMVVNGNVGLGIHVISLVYETEWLYAEEERWERRAHMIQEEKLDALGQFISGIAHELNNPLAGIIGYAQLLHDVELPDEVHSDINHIEAQAQRAKHVIGNLLTFARYRTPERELVLVNDLVKYALSLRDYHLRTNNIAVETHLAPDVPATLANGYQVQQVLLSLILNAEEALNELPQTDNNVAQKRLLVSSQVQHHEHHSEILVSVQDNGMGIPQSMQQRIFEPFFTTRSVGAGSGLGLSVAYGIITSHRGRIWLDTERAGTVFTFSLPIINDTTIAQEQPPATPEHRLHGRALVIDNEQSIAMLVQRILDHEGMQVDLASNGNEALSMLDSAHYDVLLCDLHMPQLSGKLLFDSLIHTNPDMAKRVIFMTGDVANEASLQFLKASGCHFLVKPFELPHLLQAAADVLAEKQ